MEKMANPGFGRTRLEYLVPSRGLIGFRGEFLTSTRGMGLLNTQFHGWQPWGGPMLRRINGAIVADRAGESTAYALFHLQPRGSFFVGTALTSRQHPATPSQLPTGAASGAWFRPTGAVGVLHDT